MTLQEIDEMAIIEPYCFENEQEEQWYKVGLREGADAAIKQLGWHPVSELPVIPEGKTRSVELAVYCRQANTLVLRNAVYYANGHWSELNVEYWCYPPKNE